MCGASASPRRITLLAPHTLSARLASLRPLTAAHEQEAHPNSGAPAAHGGRGEGAWATHFGGVGYKLWGRWPHTERGGELCVGHSLWGRRPQTERGEIVHRPLTLGASATHLRGVGRTL
eukprot:362362-Chlamydomonas_euryale.AAC.3